MTRATRSSPKGEQSRATIIDVAGRLFGNGGYNSTSLGDIAREVGISQAGLLHHFPSKAALLLAVLQQREEREEHQSRRGLDYFSAFLDTLDTNDRTPALVQLFAILSAESISAEHPAHDWFVERYRRVTGEAIAALAEVVDETKLPAGVTVESLARWIIGCADGLRIQWLLDPATPSRTSVMAQMFTLLRPYMFDPDRPVRGGAA